MRARRLLLTGLFITFALGVVGIYLLTTSIRNAPLTLGSSRVEASTIPVGAPGHDLALIGNAAGTWDIYLMAADGTLTNVTINTDKDAANDYFPSWALDGRQINFLANRETADELGPVQVNADGSGLKVLDTVSAIMSVALSGRFDWDPAWSPDGTHLLWSSVRDMNLEQYMIPLDVEFNISNAQRLTDDGARDWFGAWSPDGTKIVRSSDAAGNENVYVTDATTGASQQVTSSDWDDFRPVWALDGATILYIYDEDDRMTQGILNFYTIQPDGSANQPLGEAAFAGGAVWSPDALQVAYFGSETGRWQVYVMNTDGTNLRRITPDDGDYLYPVWKP